MTTGRLAIGALRSVLQNWLLSDVNRSGAVSPLIRAIASNTPVIMPARKNHGFRNSGSATLHLHAVLAAPVFEALAEGATEVTRRWQADTV